MRGTREEVPPPFAIQQASWGAERRRTAWQEEPGGVGGVQGFLGKIFGWTGEEGQVLDKLSESESCKVISLKSSVLYYFIVSA